MKKSNHKIKSAIKPKTTAWPKGDPGIANYDIKILEHILKNAAVGIDPSPMHLHCAAVGALLDIGKSGRRTFAGINNPTHEETYQALLRAVKAGRSRLEKMPKADA